MFNMCYVTVSLHASELFGFLDMTHSVTFTVNPPPSWLAAFPLNNLPSLLGTTHHYYLPSLLPPIFITTHHYYLPSLLPPIIITTHHYYLPSVHRQNV